MSQLTPARPAPQKAVHSGPQVSGRGQAGLPLALRNWRVPWRVIALIVLPVMMGMIFAGLRVAAAAGNAATFGRVEQLAVLGQQVTGLAQAMENESNLAATYLADGRPPGELADLHKQYALTDSWAGKVRALARGVGAAYPDRTRTAAAAVLARIGDLPDLRSYASASQAPVLTVITAYSLATADLFALDDNIAQEGGNAALVASVRALGALSRMKDEASQQQAILYAALAAGRFGPGALDALAAAQEQQASSLAAFTAAATLSQVQSLSDTVAGPLVDQGRALEQRAIVTGGQGVPLTRGDARAWHADMSYTIGRMRLAERHLAGLIVTQARSLHSGAVSSALFTGGAALAVLVLVLAAAVIIARSMVRPLRLLRMGALEVAGVRLPAEVRELAESGGTDLLAVEPIGVHSTDEIGQVARAFDQVHQEAVRLASGEASLRASVSAMFVSLSRRSQSLLERLLRLIDTLELGEDDPERLASLFRMDHLATRMRRHSENLLVLAGHETVRRWAEPVPLMDVIRAAVSEIEQYDRVTLDVQQGVTVTGNTVADTVHLLAELIENATMFSAKTTTVQVSAHAAGSGGVIVGVTDSGMGISAAQMEQLNRRLTSPPAADVAVSRHMGLFAVAHLAARHGIKVALQARPEGGITAQVWLPDEVTGRGTGSVWERGPVARLSWLRQPLGRAARPAPASAEAGAATTGPPRPPGLPIFDSVRSDWFRSRGRVPLRPDEPAGTEPWASTVADDGWRAAGKVLAPVVGGMTPAGLPLRTPRANLVPGSAGSRASTPGRMAEPAEAARDRLAGFQRGSRRARAGAPAAGGPQEREESNPDGG